MVAPRTVGAAYRCEGGGRAFAAKMGIITARVTNTSVFFVVGVAW